MKNDCGGITIKRIMTIFLGVSVLLSFCFSFTQDTVGMPMRDSIHLGTDLYFPETSQDPWPTLLQRTPYERDWSNLFIFFITDILGYVLVVQNLRGYGDSEGEPMVFLSDGWGELQDGYDAIEWIAAQSWSNEEVGMIGASAHGITQYYAAGAVPPHLVCCAPMVAAPGLYQHCAFTGGEFRKALVETWLQGLNTPWLIDSVCNHPNYDSIWTIVDLSQRYDLADYPMFHLDGWYDMYTDGVLEAFSELQARHHNQKLFMGPWGHGSWGSRYQGDLVYPANAEMDSLEFMVMLFDWYNYWIQDSSSTILEPKVKFYLMGDCDTQDTTYWNHWVEADTWPLPEVTYANYYLGENGSLDTVPPQIETVDTFYYNPADPCTTYGGREYIGLTHGYGPINQNPIESRPDVLIFSTPVLDSPLTVIGKLKFVLYAASDRYDTDWAVRVTDVYPDGRSILMTDGILMARHRHGFEFEDSLVPGLPDTFEIDLWSTANVFNTGHRLRVIISSSNYPRFEKNPNTGNPFQRDDPNFVVATQSVYRSASMPSHLTLPVYPGIPGVEEYEASQIAFTNLQVSPNPFREKIDISYQLPVTGNYTPLITVHESPITLSIYDAAGRLVRSFPVSLRNPNKSVVSVCWYGRDNTGQKLPSGVYFLKLTAGNYRETKKLLLIK